MWESMYFKVDICQAIVLFIEIHAVGFAKYPDRNQTAHKKNSSLD